MQELRDYLRTTINLQDTPDGRTWDRTRDLSRVKRALSR